MQGDRVRAAATQTIDAVQTVMNPVQAFIRTEASSGIILIAVALVAFAWANSPWASAYSAMLDARAYISIGLMSWK